MSSPAPIRDRPSGVAALDRDVDRTLALALLADARAGHARVLVVAGEAGIGKTTFAEAVAEAARHDGWTVAWTRTAVAARAVPFHPWVRVLEQLRHALGDRDGVPPVAAAERALGERHPTSAALPLELCAAVDQAVRAGARERPTLIVLEDVERFDRPSIGLLEFLARELANTRVLLLVTGRSTSALATVLAEPHVRHVALAGLPVEEVAALARNVTGREPARPLAERLWQRTNGNPFLVTELLRAPGDPATVVPPVVTASARDRLDGLGPPARRVVELLAVAGAPLDATVLADLGTTDVAGVLDPAMAAELVHAADDGRYLVRPPLLGDAITGLLSDAERATLHARIGEALESRGGTDDDLAPTVARHYAAAVGVVGAERAAAWSARAGHAASARHEFEDAGRHFADAIALRATVEPAPGRDTVRLMHALADAHSRGGDTVAGRAAFLRAFAAARACRASDLAAFAVLGAAWWATDLAAPDRDIESALAATAAALDDGPPGLRASVMARLARARYRTTPLAERDRLSRAALDLARAAEDRTALVFVLSERHLALGSPDSLSERLATAEEMARTAEAAGDRSGALIGYTYRALDLLEAGDGTGLEQVLALRRRDEPSSTLHTNVQTLRLAVLRATMRGDFGTADALATRAHELGRRLALAEADAVYALQTMYVCRLQGRIPDLGVNLAGAFTAWPDHPAWRIGSAVVNAVSGNLPVARDALGRLAADGFAAVPRDADWLASMALLADVAGFVDDRDVAATLIDLLTPYAERHAVLGSGVAAIGAVAFYLARVAVVRGDWDAALTHLDRADAQYAGLAAAPLAVMADQLRGFILLARDRPGDRDEGTRVLAGTRERARALGMRRVEANVTARIGEATPGAGSGRSAASPRTIRREGEYWTLVADGSTVRIRHCKGMTILAELLRHPGRDFYVRDLLEPGEGAETAGDLGPVLDDRARREYRERIGDLRAELAESEALHDAARAGRARDELERTTDELARSVGLGGRPRRAGDAGERARLVVRKRIRVALGRIRAADAVLAHHLETTIRTGLVCVYRPAPGQSAAWTS